MKQLRRIGLLGVCALLPVFAACDQPGMTSPETEVPASLALSGTTQTTPAELPRAYVSTKYAAPTGKKINVPAGGNLQNAINSALPGDQIVLQAGATYTGNFRLPKKTGTGWIVIRSSATLPAEGTRITPANRALLAKIVTPNSDRAIQTYEGAAYYRLMGLEITAASSVTGINTLLEFGSKAHHLILDRSYVHGHSNLDMRRCVLLNASHAAIIESYLTRCHSKSSDSQAILSFNSPGPLKIANNYLAGAGENIMLGGSMPATNVLPSDIEIRRNHFFKPLAWKDVWLVKNLFEIKFGQRILLEGNVFENNWADGQDGMAINIKLSNHSGRCTWCRTADITFRKNKVRGVDGGFKIYSAKRMVVENNLFEKIGERSNGRMFLTGSRIESLRIEHNTGFSQSNNMVLTGGTQSGFVMRNNLMKRSGYGVKGERSEGKPTLDYHTPGYVFARNVLITADATRYPQNNYFPAAISNVGFVDYAGGNYRLSSSSPYKGKATDGRDPGADINALESATTGVVK